MAKKTGSPGTILVEPVTGRRLGSRWAQRLIDQSFTDARTGLGNQRAFEADYCKRQQDGQIFAALLADIRGFGKFNERRGGHRRANELLRNFAEALRARLKADDTVCRWNVGDEFVINAEITRADLDGLVARLKGPYLVQWGRRQRLLECYAVGVMASGLPLSKVEHVLDERLRRLKATTKAAQRS